MAPQQPNNQIVLRMVLIIVLGFGIGYFYYSQWAVPARVPIGPPLTPGEDNLKIFENVKIDFSVLEENKYKVLKIFGEFPVNPGVTGKKDIFAPI